MNKTQFVAAWTLLAIGKLALAVALPLFGDEAFYWWEGQYLAWSYSDLPPVTAWLAALGSTLAAGEIGVRLPFLLLGLALPWQVVLVSRRWYDDATAWRAGCLALILPLASVLGIMALPDVPMLLISVVVVDLLVLALRRDALRNWLGLGLALALGLLCHYRFAALPLVLAAMMLALPEGRAALRTRGPWLAATIALLGLLPMLWFNLDHDLSGLRFQLLDRHPWTWHGSGWLQLLELAIVASPLLLGLLFWTAWSVLRGQNAPVAQRWPVAIAVGLWLLFFVLGFFADQERFRWHWSLPALVLLLPALAQRLPALNRTLRWSSLGLAMAFSVTAFAYLAMAAAPNRAGGWHGSKLFPANFSGWREAADWLQQSPDRPTRLVADNFMLAAALRFYLPESLTPSLRVLDDVLNRRHGRAAQLRIWGLDEAALVADPNRSGWIVAEESARRFSDRWAWYQGLCARFSGLKLVDQLLLFDGRKRFVRWHFDSYEPRPSCISPEAVPPLGWLDAPRRLRRGEPMVVFGWVIQTGLGIDAIEILWDGEPIARPARTIEIDWVERRWGEVGDPDGQRIGFRSVLDLSDREPGRYQLSVRVRRGDNRWWLLAEQSVRLD